MDSQMNTRGDARHSVAVVGIGGIHHPLLRRTFRLPRGDRGSCGVG
jgi:hypothetical protein